MERSDQENAILTGTLWRQLVLFGMPLLAGNLFQQMYSSVDSVIVGRYIGEGALAAVGSTTSLIFLIVSFFQGIATGASVVIARYCGAGDVQNAKISISSALLLSVGSGAVLAVFFYIMTPPILRWMLTPEDIFTMTREYLRIYMLSIPAIAVYNTGTAVMRAMGDSRRPLYFLILSSLINVALDLLFIRVLRMGVAGASLATAVAQAVSAALVVYLVMRHTGPYALQAKELRLSRSHTLRIIALGLPAAVQSSAVSFANVLFQSQVNIFGTAAVAGYSAGSRINAFIYMPCSSFGLAATTFVGQNLGAGNYDRARRCGRVCMLLSVGITLFFSILAYLLRYPLLGIFSREPEVLEYGALMLGIIGMTSFLWAFPHIYGSVITGAGRSFGSMLITMLNMCGIRLLWIFVMLRFWYDIRVVYLSFPVSWVTASICMVLYYRRIAGTLLRPPS